MLKESNKRHQMQHVQYQQKYKVNFPAEIAQLDKLKNKLKQVDFQVIQDVYDLFKSVGIVDLLM